MGSCSPVQPDSLSTPEPTTASGLSCSEFFRWSEVVARDGVEPLTFRFSVQSSPDRSRTTWHFACRSYVVEAAEASRGLELLDSLLDTATVDAAATPPRCTHRLHS